MEKRELLEPEKALEILKIAKDETGSVPYALIEKAFERMGILEREDSKH